MSTECSIETCKKTSTIFCYSCEKNLCTEHYKEHNDENNSQIEFISEQIKNLSDRYVKLDTNKLKTDAMQTINQWRIDFHNSIDRLYEQKCEELKQYLIKPQQEIDQIRAKINELNKKQKSTHEDIDQLIQHLKYVDQQIKDIETQGVPINNRLRANNDNFNAQSGDLINLLNSYRTINCSGQKGIAFAANHQSLLVYENNKFNLLNKDLILTHQVPWTNGQIYDISWSITLNQFILITNKRILYMVNENPLSFTPIKRLPQDNWWSLTCSDKYLYISTHGNDPNIHQFDLSSSSFNPIKRWRSPETCKQYESIHHINYTNETLALIIVDPSTKTSRIELRSSITLKRYWTLDLDINQSLYQSTIHSCLLKFNEWLVIPENTTDIFHITQDGKLRAVYKYKIPVWNITLFQPNLLTIRTEDNIIFYRI